MDTHVGGLDEAIHICGVVLLCAGSSAQVVGSAAWPQLHPPLLPTCETECVLLSVHQSGFVACFFGVGCKVHARGQAWWCSVLCCDTGRWREPDRCQPCCCQSLSIAGVLLDCVVVHSAASVECKMVLLVAGIVVVGSLVWVACLAGGWVCGWAGRWVMPVGYAGGVGNMHACMHA